VPKTVLAVDDSATIRKVLEITFAAEDFRVVTADGSSSALSRLGEDAVAAVIDTSLGNDDGYALAKEMRARNARLAVLLMASRYNPYDANRGRDAGADDFIEKPFDTQSLIDKVKKAIATREQTRMQVPAPAPTPSPYTSPAALNTTTPFGAPPRPPPAPSVGAATAGKPAWPGQRTHTLSFEAGGGGGLPGVIVPSSARSGGGASSPNPPQPPAPAVAPASPTPAAAVARPTAVGSSHGEPGPTGASPASNGHLASKLGELGLTSQQTDAVLALSRELIERVVWEVVPALAETLIKEEIARLTKDS
jgi:CheY-like chemotaxis protein